MSPTVAAGRFAIALAMGVGLGVFYSLLRPIRPNWLRDLGFVAGAFYSWLYLCFAVCRGDFHLGYCSGLLLGGLAWLLTAGKFLQPHIAFLGEKCRKVLCLPAKFLKKCKNFIKISWQDRKKRLQ